MKWSLGYTVNVAFWLAMAVLIAVELVSDNRTVFYGSALATLLVGVVNFVLLRDIGKRKQLEEVLRRQATRDSLTKVWNHAAIVEGLERELERANREERPLGVILVDLDHFKLVNDTHGHLAGNAVLQEATRRMAAALRPYDMIGRYGGEEFLIVAPGCDRSAVLKLGERLRKQLAEQPIHVGPKAIPVTISLGAVVDSQLKPADVHSVLHAVDLALYQAKSAGRNRIQISTDTTVP
jgi:two-component system cell cycle response regulator